METTRHFVATVYVVHDGATALHEHDKLDMWLPPGGHVDRDELPHEAGLREVREEMGLEATLLSAIPSLELPNGRPLPEPQYQLLYDIDVDAEGVGHQHIDFIYYGAVEHRQLDPDDGEPGADAWEWFTPAELRASADRLEPDVVEIGQRAIDTVGNQHR